jgi:hypothetical protein
MSVQSSHIKTPQKPPEKINTKKKERIEDHQEKKQAQLHRY